MNQYNTMTNPESLNRISVLSLNIRFGLADDGQNNWKHRKKAYPHLFNNYRTDFIGFQEVNNFQANFLKDILHEYNYIGERDPAPDFWQNNIIFYHKKWECTCKDHFYLSPTPDIPSQFEKSKWPRQCTIGVFQHLQNKIIVANTHFDFDSGVQTQSAALIMRRLSDISSEIPAILVGDFNNTPYSPCYNIFVGQKTEGSYKEAMLFKDAFAEPFPGTFHGFSDNAIGDHIDWILYRGGLTPEDTRILPGRMDKFYLSDHFPLFAVFKCKNEKT